MLDGECKSSENEGHEVLVFYLTQQLAWEKTALSFLSSPRSMSLFKIEERPPIVDNFQYWRRTFQGLQLGLMQKKK